MAEDAFCAYPELFHYTTAVGLDGIISNRTLWATHYEFVNDSEEFRAFFNNRLPLIMEAATDEFLNSVKVVPDIKKYIRNKGGLKAIKREVVKDMTEMMRNAAHGIFEPYLLSFCAHTSEENARNGLLSQWRGYGADGGYAIVFDTKKIRELVELEYQTNHYHFLHPCMVTYNDRSITAPSTYPEILKLEEELIDLISNFIKTSEREYLEQSTIPILLMASSHKDIGFSEEKEIRVVGIPISRNQELLLEEPYRSSKGFIKDSFYTRNGLLIPYIKLFQERQLPIKRIIVGPHPDKARRIKSVEKLLFNNGISVEVIASETPYIGKY